MYQTYTISVDNLRCSGCVTTITRRVNSLAGVTGVRVDAANGRVSFDARPGAVHLVRDTLLALGYPERGTTSGLSAVGTTARSIVSCAVGRLGAS